LALPLRLAQALQTLGEREGISLFVTLLAAFLVLLYRYSNRHEILVGCRVTRRTRPEITGAIDVATDPFAVRTELSGDLPFRVLLHRVSEAVLGPCPQQGCPSREAKLPRPWAADRDSPFQIMFLFQEDSTRAGQPSGRDLRSRERDSNTASYELLLD